MARKREINVRRKILQACLDLLTDPDEYLDDFEISKKTGIWLRDVRDSLKSLERDGLVRLTRTEDRYKVLIEAEGRLELSQRNRAASKQRVLQACSDLTIDNNFRFVSDNVIAKITRMKIQDVRDCLVSLSQKSLVETCWHGNYLESSLTATGRLALAMERPFPDKQPQSLGLEPSQPNWSDDSRPESSNIRRRILQACYDLTGYSDRFVDDVDISKKTEIWLRDVRDSLKCLERDGLVSLARTEDRYKVLVEAEGRLELSQRNRAASKQRVLQACSDLTRAPVRFVADIDIAKLTRMRMQDVRDCLLALAQNMLVEIVKGQKHFLANITPLGESSLNLQKPLPDKQFENLGLEQSQPNSSADNIPETLVSSTLTSTPPSKAPSVRTLLFLAANPKGTPQLRLDEEVKKVEQGLERSKKRDQFKLVQKWAVTDDELRRALLDNEPEIVHFSGHGSGASGLTFEDDQGNVLEIPGDALARLFELCADSVKCVVLNACHSEAQANAISQHIDYVIGMSKDIGDEASIKFAVGFYDALGAGRDFETAYRFGCSAIDLKGIPEYLTPVLKKKSISATVPTPPSSASPPDASSAGLPGPQSGVHSPSVPLSGSATAPVGDPGNVVTAAGTASLTSATAKITGPIRLFYSYSHKIEDETLRDELEEALALLKRQGLISGWHDRKIGAGDEWKGAIDKNLEEAQVVLLLVSASFLASDYCWDVETKRAIERHDQGEAKVIPVILRPCDWHGAPFGKLQSLPKDGKAVTSWTNKDEAWTDVALGIRRAIETMRGSSA